MNFHIVIESIEFYSKIFDHYFSMKSKADVKVIPQKTILLTHSIAQFEKLVAELEMIQNDTHPTLLSLKETLNETYKEQCQHYDKHLAYQKHLIELQYQCEIQQINDEVADSQSKLTQ